MDATTLHDQKAWVARLQSRDSGAWSEFALEFHDLVCCVIRRTAARRQIKLQASDVDDLAADVFVAALASLARFRHECRLKTWLSTITRRVVDRALGKAAHRAIVRTDLAHASVADSKHQPLEKLLRSEDQARVSAAFDMLPARGRLILRLHYVQRLSYRAISERLGISINSVGPALARGRRRLRWLLEESMHENVDKSH